MKSQRAVIVALGWLTLMYVVFTLVNFAELFFSGTTKQYLALALAEQFFNTMMPLIAFVPLVLAIVGPVRSRLQSMDLWLLLGFFCLLYLSGVSLGVHFVGQLGLTLMPDTTQALLYQFLSVSDEYVGHLFLVCWYGGLYLLSLLEMRRHDIGTVGWVPMLLGLVGGVFLFGANVEGGSMYLLTLPAGLLGVASLVWFGSRQQVPWYRLGLASYFVSSSLVMIGLTVGFVVLYGPLVQFSSFF